jgi:hypothetical protein
MNLDFANRSDRQQNVEAGLAALVRGDFRDCSELAEARRKSGARSRGPLYKCHRFATR